MFSFSQEINADDEKALEMFMSKKPEARLTLADMIMEKITEKQTEIQTQFTDAESRFMSYFSFINYPIKTVVDFVNKICLKYSCKLI